MILFWITIYSDLLREFSFKNYFKNNFYVPKMRCQPKPYQEPLKDARFIVTLLRRSVKPVLKNLWFSDVFRGYRNVTLD